MLAFEEYKKLGQYRYLNSDYTLGDFKFIYFWEWFHRFWARIIGMIAFPIPLIYFIWKRYITSNIAMQCAGLFLLGAAQGLLGWIMVASGLNDENLYVSHIKLAIHFVSAMVLIAATYITALRLLIPSTERIVHTPLKRFTWVILFLLLVQLAYGAFMAGLKGGAAASTWPDINGHFFPSSLTTHSWVSYAINIHFVHRNLAYLLVILVVIWFFRAKQIPGTVAWRKFIYWPMIWVGVQVLLGIFTVIHSAQTTRNGFGMFEYLAQAHQLVAMFLALSLVKAAFLLHRSN
jgi:heme a synthase